MNDGGTRWWKNAQVWQSETITIAYTATGYNVLCGKNVQHKDTKKLFKNCRFGTRQIHMPKYVTNNSLKLTSLYNLNNLLVVRKSVRLTPFSSNRRTKLARLFTMAICIIFFNSCGWNNICISKLNNIKQPLRPYTTLHLHTYKTNSTGKFVVLSCLLMTKNHSLTFLSQHDIPRLRAAPRFWRWGYNFVANV